VRAEGLEPSRSLKHGHLKPGCLPIPPRPQAHRSYRSGEVANKSTQAAPEYRLGVSTTRRRRPALIVLVILAAGGCLALGWWQWTRFQSTSGTFQNLGYAMQWPLFAGFCVYAYRKFVRYEEVPPEPQKDRAMTELPDGLLPERPKPIEQQPNDPALQEYNAYLAELAKADDEKHQRQNRTTA
jgi:DNA-binding transcriptional regulator of glucitol operon